MKNVLFHTFTKNRGEGKRFVPPSPISFNLFFHNTEVIDIELNIGICTY